MSVTDPVGTRGSRSLPPSAPPQAVRNVQLEARITSLEKRLAALQAQVNAL